MKPFKLSLVLAIACIALIGASKAPASSQSTEEELLKRQEELQRQKRETKEKLEQTEEQIREKNRQLMAKERALQQRKSRQRELEHKLAAYEIQKNYIGSLIAETAENLGNLRELARQRIRELYKEGTKPYLAFLLEAKNDVDFVDRVFYARLLIAHDYQTFSRLKRSHGQLQSLSRKYEELSRQTANLKEQVEKESAILRADIKRFEKEKRALLSNYRAFEEALDELEKEDREIGNALRALRGQGKLITPFDGVFKWPVRGRISSGFGMRRHPILKKRKFHSGVDIALPRGEIVSASASGTVVLADYKGGYGLTVVIVHGEYKGDSYSTLYAHMDELLVEEGAVVEKGDPIGKVGCTGLCTGPHLHFSVFINGKPLDPLKFLK